jgi:LysM repeat protein
VNRDLPGIHWRKLLLARSRFWLVSFVMVISFVGQGLGASYVVKRGDTLHSIAKAHGISLATLAERNGLSRNAHVYAGQRLTLPGGPEKSAASRDFAIPDSVQRAINETRVRPGRWKYIVIHHSGVDTGTVASMDRYHREVRHMENGIAYHFVIGNGSGMKDGAIAVCPRWTKQLEGGHLASDAQNQVALGICLVGNFDNHKPTAAQMKSLRSLVQALMARCRLTPAAVKTHQQINVVHTHCPGTKFPVEAFRKGL